MIISEFENFDNDWEMTVLPQPKAPGMAVVPPLKNIFTLFFRKNMISNYFCKKSKLTKVGRKLLDGWKLTKLEFSGFLDEAEIGTTLKVWSLDLYQKSTLPWTHGNRASRTRCPVSNGWSEGSLSEVGRGVLTGHRVTIVWRVLTPLNSNSITTSSFV